MTQDARALIEAAFADRSLLASLNAALRDLGVSA